ncbi:MAG: helix-turn-helix domain-containing protein [Phocaeicola plebeius]|nr:helix-turn-helix domain-containing protein [Phocaeicola plebeius]
MFLTGKPDILKVMGNITTQTAAENLAMVVLPKTAWEGVVSEIQELKNILQKKSEEEVNNQWIESTQARKMLGVSPKTWQTYRDERRIPFSQFGRKIYVKRADLEAFMESHYIQSR